MPICQNITKKTIVYRVFQIHISRNKGGYGGLHHCLIPQPKHILIDREKTESWQLRFFSEQQTSQDVLKILGYDKKINSNKSKHVKFENLNKMIFLSI
jgi:hypothetical protein